MMHTHTIIQESVYRRFGGAHVSSHSLSVGHINCIVEARNQRFSLDVFVATPCVELSILFNQLPVLCLPDYPRI